jgi:hypothetical protein
MSLRRAGTSKAPQPDLTEGLSGGGFQATLVDSSGISSQAMR